VKSAQGADEPIAAVRADWRNSGRAHAVGRAAIPASGTASQLRLLSEVLREGSWVEGDAIVVVGDDTAFLERRAAVGGAIDQLNRRDGWTRQASR
jgi:hypothetical protein